MYRCSAELQLWLLFPWLQMIPARGNPFPARPLCSIDKDPPFASALHFSGRKRCFRTLFSSFHAGLFRGLNGTVDGRCDGRKLGEWAYTLRLFQWPALLSYEGINTSSRYKLSCWTYANSPTFIKTMVRFRSLAWITCQPSRAILAATALKI